MKADTVFPMGVFVLFTVLGFWLITVALVDRTFMSTVLQSSFSRLEPRAPSSLNVSSCTAYPPLDTVHSTDLVLRTLMRHQQVCRSFLTDTMMLFTDMPKDATIAKSDAEAMAKRLQEFHAYGVRPLVIVEPTSAWGLIDFEEFNTGFYDDWIDIYFLTLKEQGVSQDQMGIWVPFPEANIPTWNKNSASPRDFSNGVNRYSRILKTYFPDTDISVLLNSATYDNEDYDWLYGEYVSLRPYVEGLDKSLISSVGLQGFPWVPKLSSGSNALEDANEFLNHRLLQEAADIIDVKQVWFNTGTFGAKYTQEPLEMVIIPAEKRKAILDGIYDEAVALEDKGYTVWINLFIEDKSLTVEQTDWSFKTDDDKQVFKDFVASLGKQEIELSLFDQDLSQ